VAGSRPWGKVGPAPMAGGADRKLVFDGRVMGTVTDWSGSWGWVTPLQKITHPSFRNKLYAHRKDVKGGAELAVGATVDFLLYLDKRGLGAGDIRDADAEEAQRPQAGVADVAAAGEDEVLPEGWEKIWSEEHSEYYYWNKIAKEASWVPPEVEEGAEEEDDGELPEGWTKNFDPDHNEYYYWHAPTKTTTWERPRKAAEEAPEDEEEEPAKEAEPEVRPAAEGPVLGQTRVKGRVEKWQGFFGWIRPTEELSDELKPLLENRQDKVYCNWRDVQEGTTIKAGSLVDFLLYADDNGLGASDVRLQKDGKDGQEEVKAPAPAKGRNNKRGPPKDAVELLAEQWARQDAQLMRGAGEAEEREAAGAAELPALGVAECTTDEDAPLLPGWEQVWSEEHACFYYWHKTAKQASWDRPCMPVDPRESRKDKVWEGEGAEEGASRMATPITPVLSQAGKEITPLTPATAADKEEARLTTKQPSAAFRAAQAAGTFLGRGWTGASHGEAAGGDEHALSYASVNGKGKGGKGAAKPAVAKRPATPQAAPQWAKGGAPGKGGARPFSAWAPAGGAKRPRTY